MISYKQFICEKLNISNSIKNRILSKSNIFCGLEFEFKIQEKYLPTFDIEHLTAEYEKFIRINETSETLIFPQELKNKLMDIDVWGLVQTIENIYYGYKRGMVKSFKEGLRKAGTVYVNPFYFLFKNKLQTIHPHLIDEEVLLKFPYKLFFAGDPSKTKLDKWNITYDLSDRGLYEIVSPILTISEAVEAIQKVNSFIKDFGYTTDTCGFHVHISSDKTKHYNIDLIKLISLIDEDTIYSIFDQRKDNDYATSINSFVTNLSDRANKYIVTYDDFIKIIRKHLPYDHYFAMDFTKLWRTLPSIEFRYIGGTGYENKTTDIINIITEFTYIMEASTNKSIKLKDVSSENLYKMYQNFINQDKNVIRKAITKLYNMVKK